MFQTNDHMLGLYRTTIQSTTELMMGSCRGFERLVKFQNEAIQETMTNGAEIQQQIESARNVQDLQGIHNRMVRSQIGRSMSFITDFYALASVSQIEFVRQAQTRLMDFVDGVGLTLDEDQTPGAAPVVSALRLVVDATRSSCAAGLQATEKAVMLSAAQIGASHERESSAAEQRAKDAAEQAQEPCKEEAKKPEEDGARAA